jgi:hypothetical protein
MTVSPSKCREFTPHLSNKTALHSRSRVFDAFVGPRPQAYPPHQCYRKDDAPCVTNLKFARGAAAIDARDGQEAMLQSLLYDHTILKGIPSRADEPLPTGRGAPSLEAG